jgi:hypothetical protein
MSPSTAKAATANCSDDPRDVFEKLGGPHSHLDTLDTTDKQARFLNRLYALTYETAAAIAPMMCGVAPR